MQEPICRTLTFAKSTTTTPLSNGLRTMQAARGFCRKWTYIPACRHPRRHRWGAIPACRHPRRHRWHWRTNTPPSPWQTASARGGERLPKNDYAPRGLRRPTLGRVPKLSPPRPTTFGGKHVDYFKLHNCVGGAVMQEAFDMRKVNKRSAKRQGRDRRVGAFPPLLVHVDEQYLGLRGGILIDDAKSAPAVGGRASSTHSSLAMAVRLR